jgi:hypothetical protein
MQNVIVGERNASPRVMARLICATGASAIAILINTALLMLADSFGLVTARGGLLTLALRQVPHYAALHPVVGSYMFQLSFHIAIGIAMGVVYAFTLVFLPGSGLRKGLVYALLVWLANACIILPLIGQGFAGHRVLGLDGMLYFALVHTLFFIICAVLFERCHARTYDGARALA